MLNCMEQKSLLCFFLLYKILQRIFSCDKKNIHITPIFPLRLEWVFIRQLWPHFGDSVSTLHEKPRSDSGTIVLVLDGTLLEKGAYVSTNICHLICLRHLKRSKAVTNRIFFSEKNSFPSCVRNIL